MKKISKTPQKRLLLTSEKVRELNPLKTAQLHGVVGGVCDDCSWTEKTANW